MKQLDRSIAPALQNGLAVLELLATNGKEVGFNAVAAHLGVSKATTSRLLNVLRHKNYIVKDEQNGKYRPGPRMSLLNKSLPMIEILRKETPGILQSLMDATGNTCLFIFWNGQELQCLNKKIHQGSVPMQEIGHVDSDLTAGPWGWIVYNSMNKEERKRAEEAMTGHPAYKQIYPRWKIFYDKYNFCYDDQELYPPLRRLATPVYDNSGNVAGALAVGGNSLTIKDNQVLKLGKILIEHAERLMERI